MARINPLSYIFLIFLTKRRWRNPHFSFCIAFEKYFFSIFIILNNSPANSPPICTQKITRSITSDFGTKGGVHTYKTNQHTKNRSSIQQTNILLNHIYIPHLNHQTLHSNKQTSRRRKHNKGRAKSKVFEIKKTAPVNRSKGVLRCTTLKVQIKIKTCIFFLLKRRD